MIQFGYQQFSADVLTHTGKIYKIGEHDRHHAEGLWLRTSTLFYLIRHFIGKNIEQQFIASLFFFVYFISLAKKQYGKKQHNTKTCYKTIAHQLLSLQLFLRHFL